MHGTMKVLTLAEPGKLHWEERPIPECPPGWALVKMEAVGICGSDIHAFAGRQPYFTYPRVLGHELCGRVVEATGSGFAEGERVTAIPYLPCGACSGCRHGRPNACIAMTTFGVHIDGGLAEYLCLPAAALVRAPDAGLAPNQIAMLEPLAIGAHAARRAAPLPGETALVFGAGPIGVAAAEFLKLAGVRVVFAEANAKRAGHARAAFGYDALNPLAETFVTDLTRHFGEPSVDLVVDATGSKASMDESYRHIRSGGRAVFVGLFAGSFEIDDPYFHARESELRISRNATREDFERVADAAAQRAVAIDSYVSHTGPFAEMLETLPAWVAAGAEVFKAAVHFDRT